MARNAEPLLLRCRLLPFRHVLSIEELFINATLCLVDISLSFLLTSWMFVAASISCLNVIPEKPTFELGNLAFVLITRFSSFFAHTSVESVGMLFVPAWTITWEGVD